MESPLPNDEESLRGSRDWPHAPPHRIGEGRVFLVTARCVDRALRFDTEERRDLLLERLQTLSVHYGWKLEAWAVLANHYHFVALCDEQETGSLQKWLRHLHGDSARHINRLDSAAGRQVWHNFRETKLTYQRSYLARLNYVHHNPAHHRLVKDAAQWRWCSAAAFERAVTPAWAKTIASFRYDGIAAADGE